MLAKIQKWGNSQGLRLSKELLVAAQLESGDEVVISVLDGSLVVTPARRVRGGLDLAGLVARIPEGYVQESDPWGRPLGGEVW